MAMKELQKACNSRYDCESNICIPTATAGEKKCTDYEDACKILKDGKLGNVNYNIVTLKNIRDWISPSKSSSNKFLQRNNDDLETLLEKIYDIPKVENKKDRIRKLRVMVESSISNSQIVKLIKGTNSTQCQIITPVENENLTLAKLFQEKDNEQRVGLKETLAEILNKLDPESFEFQDYYNAKKAGIINRFALYTSTFARGVVLAAIKWQLYIKEQYIDRDDIPETPQLAKEYRKLVKLTYTNVKYFQEDLLNILNASKKNIFAKIEKIISQKQLVLDVMTAFQGFNREMNPMDFNTVPSTNSRIIPYPKIHRVNRMIQNNLKNTVIYASSKGQTLLFGCFGFLYWLTKTPMMLKILDQGTKRDLSELSDKSRAEREAYVIVQKVIEICYPDLARIESPATEGSCDVDLSAKAMTRLEKLRRIILVLVKTPVEKIRNGRIFWNMYNQMLGEKVDIKMCIPNALKLLQRSDFNEQEQNLLYTGVIPALPLSRSCDDSCESFNPPPVPQGLQSVVLNPVELNSMITLERKRGMELTRKLVPLETLDKHFTQFTHILFSYLMLFIIVIVLRRAYGFRQRRDQTFTQLLQNTTKRTIKPRGNKKYLDRLK